VRRAEVAGVNIQVPRSRNVVGLVLNWSSETPLRDAMVDLKAVDEDIASVLAAVVLIDVLKSCRSSETGQRSTGRPQRGRLAVTIVVAVSAFF